MLHNDVIRISLGNDLPLKVRLCTFDGKSRYDIDPTLLTAYKVYIGKRKLADATEITSKTLTDNYLRFTVPTTNLNKIGEYTLWITGKYNGKDISLSYENKIDVVQFGDASSLEHCMPIMPEHGHEPYHRHHGPVPEPLSERSMLEFDGVIIPVEYSDEQIAELKTKYESMYQGAQTAAALAMAAASAADSATDDIEEEWSSLKETIEDWEGTPDDAPNSDGSLWARENYRAEEEAIRRAAENIRVTNENARKSQESTRQSNESARVSAESLRQSAEGSVNSQTGRAWAEYQRSTAEEQRTTTFRTNEGKDTQSASATGSRWQRYKYNEGTASDTADENGSRWARYNHEEDGRTEKFNNKLADVTQAISDANAATGRAVAAAVAAEAASGELEGLEGTLVYEGDEVVTVPETLIVDDAVSRAQTAATNAETYKNAAASSASAASASASAASASASQAASTLANAATKAYVDEKDGALQSELGGKASTTDLAAKADKTYVDTQLASKADKTAVEGIVETKEIGHRSANLLDPTACTNQYVNANTGAVASASTRRATDFIPITTDGIYLRGFAPYGSVGGMAYYNANKTYISGSRTGNNAGQYFPYVDGAAYCRFTINPNDTSGSECYAVPNSEPHVYEEYGSGTVTTAKALNEDILTAMPALSLAGENAVNVTASTLTDGVQQMTDAPYYIKGCGVLALSAKVSALNEFRIGFGYGWANSLHLKVDGTKLYILRNADAVKNTFTHGLSIEDFVNVAFSFDKETATIYIGTKDGSKTFKSNNVYIESYGRPYVYADASTTLTDVSLSYTCPKFRSPIWVVGDSYTSLYEARWTYQMVKTFGVDQFLIDGYAGSGSDVMFADFKRALANGTPRFLLWCMGMNDTFAKWKKYYDQVAQICDAYGIELILQTIPIPSSGAAEKQSINAFIKASGNRYVDICAAVSPDSSATWYDGYNDDGTHPTILGAKAIASRFLADVPEFLQTKGFATQSQLGEISTELTELSGAAVKVTEQTLTDTQKAQARANIGAAAEGSGGGSAEWKLVFDGAIDVGTRNKDFTTFADNTPLNVHEILVQVVMTSSQTTENQCYLMIASGNDSLNNSSYYGPIVSESRIATESIPYFSKLHLHSGFGMVTYCDYQNAATKGAVAQYAQSHVNYGGVRNIGASYSVINAIRLSNNASIQGVTRFIVLAR